MKALGPVEKELPALTIGLDVISGESSLPRGAVRRATNITIQNNGNWQRRLGPLLANALPGAHSFWVSPAQTRALAVADDTLYEVDLPSCAVAPLFVGLTPDEPVEYTDVNADVVFTSRGVLRKLLPDGRIRRPGVANVFGSAPVASPSVGALQKGRYGVAYTLVNDLGEESPCSSIAWVDLTYGGILLGGFVTAEDVTSINLYATLPNGEDLYRYATVPLGLSGTISDPTPARLAKKLYRQMMPSGAIVRQFKGRLWVVDGKWIWASDPLDYGVCDIKAGWMTLARTINVFEPVESGIHVGFRERTVFLRGTDPKAFEMVASSNRGAAPHSGTTVKADFFNPNITPNRDLPVAVWLSEAGLAIGRADGSVAFPQAGRLLVDAGPSRPLFAQHQGIKQGVFCSEYLNVGIGGAVDTIL